MKTVGLLAVAVMSTGAHAVLVAVAGPVSSKGDAATIIVAPDRVVNSDHANLAQQGFDERQGVVTSIAHATDSGFIAAGTAVDSHMIFLNKPDNEAGNIMHMEVTWTFDGLILGIMSDSAGALEVASTFELGALGTVYPGAAFGARGMEAGQDGYSVNGNQITVNMHVTQPGDWIRVITAHVPEPGTLVLLGIGLAGLGLRRRTRAA